MKKVLVLLFLFWLVPNVCFASGIDTSSIDEMLGEFNSEFSQYMPDFDFVKLFYNEDGLMSASEFFKNIVKMLNKELIVNIALLSKLIMLAVISAVVGNLEYSFNNDINKVARLVIYLVIVFMVVSSTQVIMGLMASSVSRMSNFLEALLPIQLVLLVAMGANISASMLSPTLFFMLYLLDKLMQVVLCPLVSFVIVLSIVNNLSTRYKLERLAILLRKLTLGILGVVSSLFAILLGVEGLSGVSGDASIFKGAKYVLGAMPMVGGVLENSLDAIFTGSLFIKNTFGIASLVIIMLLLIIPVIKILAIAFMYKLAAALVEPLGENVLDKLLNDVGNAFLLALAVVVMVGLALFFAMVVVIATANFVVMLR